MIGRLVRPNGEVSIERRVDRLARLLADGEPGIFRSVKQPAGVESAFDSIARAVEVPITRRRAMGVAGVAIAVGAFLRPGRAVAAGQCPSGGPNVCTNSHGARVCVPANLQCCSNDNCAIACPYPWRDCKGPANCSDTARMCRDPTADGYDKAKTKFCSQEVPVTNGCVDGGTSIATRGWCCKPTELCSSQFGECLCQNECGDQCCKSTEECVNLGLLRGQQCKEKCKPGWHHDGDECVCDHGQTCGVTCCKEGSECVGSKCVKPQDPSKTPSPWDAFTGFFDSINQTAASRGGGSQRRALVAIGAQATPAVANALVVLSALNAQGIAAGASLGVRRVDPAYRRKVVAAKPSVPPIAAGPGLDPKAAAALQALVAAESNGFALALATGTALARSRGAIHRHDMTAARRQVLAAAGFADRAAKALRAVPALRAAAATALTSTGAIEVIATADKIVALLTTLRTSGIPADLKAALKALGVTASSDLASVKAGLLASTSGGGPTLIAPLTDPARTRNIQAMATDLAAFAKAARHRPITSSRGGPRRYRQAH